MAESVDISVMVRYTGYARSTIARWLNKAGQHSPQLHDILFRGLVIPLVQVARYCRQPQFWLNYWLMEDKKRITRIIVIDDHRKVHTALRALLIPLDDIELIPHGSSAQETLDL